MATRTTRIELTEDELQQEREAAAKRALEMATEAIPDDIGLLARVQTGLVTTQDLAKMFDLHEQTVREKFTPVRDDTSPYWYRVEELADQIAPQD